jgi:hypothetical protein
MILTLSLAPERKAAHEEPLHRDDTGATPRSAELCRQVSYAAQ